VPKSVSIEEALQAYRQKANDVNGDGVSVEGQSSAEKNLRGGQGETCSRDRFTNGSVSFLQLCGS